MISPIARKLIALQQREFWLKQRLLFQSRHLKFATEVVAIFHLGGELIRHQLSAALGSVIGINFPAAPE